MVELAPTIPSEFKNEKDGTSKKKVSNMFLNGWMIPVCQPELLSNRVSNNNDDQEGPKQSYHDVNIGRYQTNDDQLSLQELKEVIVYFKIPKINWL